MTLDLTAVVPDANASPWIQCPFCGEEWTKLRPCAHWQNGKPITSHVCVRCAETPQGIFALSKRYPIDGATVDFDGDKGLIAYGEIQFLVVSSGMKVKVLRKGKDPVVYDNVFQAWFAIKQQLSAGDDPVTEKNWARLRKKKSLEVL